MMTGLSRHKDPTSTTSCALALTQRQGYKRRVKTCLDTKAMRYTHFGGGEEPPRVAVISQRPEGMHSLSVRYPYR